MAAIPKPPAGCPLTPHQWQYLKHAVVDGMKAPAIARLVGVTPSTVRTLLFSCYRALGVNTVAQAAVAIYEAGWLDDVAPITDYGDRRITHAQTLYLDAFNEFLAERNNPERQAKARAKMLHHLLSIDIEGEAHLALPAASMCDLVPDKLLRAVLAPSFPTFGGNRNHLDRPPLTRRSPG